MTERTDRFNSATKLLDLLELAVKSLRLYSPNHPHAEEALERTWHGAFAYLGQYGRAVYDFEDGQIFFDGALMVEASVTCTEVISIIERGQGNRLIFEPGLTRELLADFLSLLAIDGKNELPDEEHDVSLGDQMRNLGLEHVEIKRMSRRMMKKKAVKKSVGEREALYLKYERAIADLSAFFDDIRSGRPLNLTKTRAIAVWITDTIGKDRDCALSLTALRNRDEYLCHHSLNVALFSSALGKTVGLHEDDLGTLALAALLHDVGKAILPTEIFKKHATLTSEEWTLMASHPAKGVHLINDRLEGESAAIVLAFEHHIGADLSGYPNVSDTWRPHIFSRILQVADVYEGMTGDRPYRRPKLRTEAVVLMLGDLAHLFEPALVRLFFQILGVYPIGSVVRLSSGDLALVRGVDSNDLRQPIVKTLTDSPGRILRLSKEPSIAIDEVVDAGTAGVNLAHALSSE